MIGWARVCGAQCRFVSDVTGTAHDVFVWRPPELLENTRGLNVALVGAPNAGKSSLLNSILGEKVSAVSRKFNTTRHRMLGVCTEGRAQLVFFDTPGIVAKEERGRYFKPLVVTAAQSVPMADVVVLVVDIARRWDWGARNTLREVVALAAHSGARLVVAANKGDLLGHKHELVTTKLDKILDDWEAVASELGAPGPDDTRDVAMARLLRAQGHGPSGDFLKAAPEPAPEPADAPPQPQRGAASTPTDGPTRDSRRALADQMQEVADWDSDVAVGDLGSFPQASASTADDAEHSDVPAARDPEQDRLLVWAADVESLFLTSALRGEGVTDLKRALFKMAVPRTWSYSSSVTTDMTDAERVKELIREQLYRCLHREVPFLTRQETRVWEMQPDGTLHINQDIQVPSKRHARMLTGRSGGALAAIIRNAVPHIEKVVGCRVRLGLHVAIKNKLTPES